MQRSPPVLWPAPVRAVAGLFLGLTLLALVEAGLRTLVPEEAWPPRADRLSLADVGAGAYVHRRDSVAGAWLEVVDGRVRTRPARRPEGISSVDVSQQTDPSNIRIVALGGSTTRGVPFDHIGGGFVAELAPSRSEQSWEVLNLGVPGMDARGVAQMAREARQLRPDVLVVYTGNNEVMGDLLDRCVRPGRVWLAHTLDRALGFRLLRQSLRGNPTGATVTQARTAQNDCTQARIAEAWLRGRTRWRGALDPRWAPGVRLPAPRWDPAAGAVKARLIEALDQMALQAAQLHIPMVLAVPPVNLRTAPGHALGAPGSSHQTAARVDQQLQNTHSEGVSAWTAALQIDAHRADALHGWGLARLSAGDTSASTTRALQAAVDHDYASRRPTGEVLRQLRAACARWSHVSCVELSEVLAGPNGGEIMPEQAFADHCHPSQWGNRRIAQALSAAIEDTLRTPR